LSSAGDIDLPLASTFVVVPAYNEEKVIGSVVGALCKSFPNVVVIDDGSSDRTLSILKGFPVKTVSHSVNLGQGAAIQTGITYSLAQGAEYIVTFDADGQHRVEDALAVLREVHAGGCDVACGSRFLGTAPKIPRARKLLLKAAILFSNLNSRVKLTDAHNGLRAFNRKAALRLDISQSGMAHASEINTLFARHGMVIHEVPVHIDYTEYSLAKGQSSSNAFNILIDLVVGRFLK
jgi:glycosyltransferase involved in cell wall biosynthesis